VGDVLGVTIEKIVPNGFGLAFTENLTVFVPLSAQGDKLSVKIHQIKGKTAFAEIIEILEPSVDRIEPPCPYFGRCGGCDFQQMNYKAQLAAKAAMVRDSLSRIGRIKIEKDIDVVPSSREFGYRSRAQWHIDTRAHKIGYFQRNSHNLIDVETCPILTGEMQSTLTELRETVEWESFWSNIVEIEAASSGEGETDVSIYSAEIIEPTEEISFTSGGNQYFYDATTFFQGNPFLIEELVETALKEGCGGTALDLYCGVGLFTLALAKKFEKVIGVEGNEQASDFARKNLENAGAENVEIHCENISDYLTENAGQLKNINFVLLDPPRVGAEQEIIEGIIKIKPAQISYVSCEPSTLARDLRVLCDNGYAIDSIIALDLFPQTHHVETIVRLKLEAEQKLK
jgi:23S rRNA (uracil1939-C5)-methyltransferase